MLPPPVLPPPQTMLLPPPVGPAQHRPYRPGTRVAVAVVLVAAVLAGLAVFAWTDQAGRRQGAERWPAAPPWLPQLSAPVAYPDVPPSGATPDPSAGSPSVSPSAAASPSRSRATASARPAPQPLLTVAREPVPGTVDLSQEGSLDWVHWGLTGPSDVNRKPDGAPAIAELGGRRGRYDNNPEVFRWSAGRPTDSVDATPTGVYTCGAGASFTLSVPAGPTTRTLRYYAGVWKARGRLDVSLSPSGEQATAWSENQQAITTNRFTIRFRAPDGGRLLVRWTADAVFDSRCGNIDMQAATLR